MAGTVNNWNDGFSFTGGSGTIGPYYILGGRYAFAMSATWGGGNAVLNILMPNGSTYVQVAPTLSADGSSIVDLPAGEVEIVITTATAAMGFLARVPYRAA